GISRDPGDEVERVSKTEEPVRLWQPGRLPGPLRRTVGTPELGVEPRPADHQKERRAADADETGVELIAGAPDARDLLGAGRRAVRHEELRDEVAGLSRPRDEQELRAEGHDSRRAANVMGKGQNLPGAGGGAVADPPPALIRGRPLHLKQELAVPVN